jgi:hypothetical protein
VAWRVAEGAFALEITAPVGLDVTVVAPDGASTVRRFLGGTFAEKFPLLPDRA